jgi:hypothetical protein
VHQEIKARFGCVSRALVFIWRGVPSWSFLGPSLAFLEGGSTLFVHPASPLGSSLLNLVKLPPRHIT